MKIINEKLMKQFENFFTTIKHGDKIALFHDTDPDGTTSGKIIYEAVKRLGGDIELFVIDGSHTISDKIIEQLKENGITRLITTDKSVDEGPEQIKKIEQFAEICVFDHHVIQHDISSSKTVFLKPQLVFDTDRPDQYCSAKFTYDLLNRVIDLSDLDWVCVSGIIGDMAYPTWKEFVHGVFEKYQIEGKEDIFASKLGVLTQYISFAEAMGESEECFEIMLQVNSLDEALQKLDKYTAVKKDVEHYYDNFEELSEKHGNLFFIEIKSEYHIKSIVASRVSKKKHPHSTLIVVQKAGEWMAVSARRSDSAVDMNKLLKKSLEELNGSGGGHVPASGASVHMNDFAEFKKRIIENARRME